MTIATMIFWNLHPKRYRRSQHQYSFGSFTQWVIGASAKGPKRTSQEADQREARDQQKPKDNFR